MNSLIAVVAVEKTFFSLDSDYDYSVPSDLIEKIELGTPVIVPFGNGNTERKGYVVKLYNGINARLKTLIAFDQAMPKISTEFVSLALWLKERCFCTTYECIKLALPVGCGKVGTASKKAAVLAIENEEKLPKLTPKQKSVTDILFDVGTAYIDELCEICSVGRGVIKNLEKLGVITVADKEIYRTPYNINAAQDKKSIILSPEQDAAFKKYLKLLDNGGGTGLLYGVTGSGKTQVYLKLIDEAVRRKKGVIVLVPEISLTPQALSIFKGRYGEKVAVFHSGLSLGERYDEYKRADKGKAQIVVGTRSAVFAPVHNLGLIIMDEEQEGTYKSERTPKYNAKDVANFRCRYNKALFLMTSATPSLDAYSNALNGKYTLCELNNRFGDAQLPQVITVDMKQELKNGLKSPVSSRLKELIAQTLDDKKQVILLINRRGFNTFIACNDCGYVITCPNCSISLTYHSYNNRLVCHYCGYTRTLDNVCPECSGTNIRYSGYGTQRIENELDYLFPNARILRMDADTTTTKFSHDKLFNSFANHEYDILIGTQMVAKGLDFPDVSLVGVVNADNSLYDESFNSGERAFDLITQVVGRSGRRDCNGKAVIQTINPNNPIIGYAAMQDYKGFFEDEIQLRRLLTYPPYCDIISAVFVGENENDVALCAKHFFEILKKLNSEYNEKIIVLGPSPAKLFKLNNSFRYRISVKCKNSKNIRSMFSEILKKISMIKKYKDISVSLDLNPYDLN